MRQERVHAAESREISAIQYKKGGWVGMQDKVMSTF